jgi:hypothetical protein
MIRTFVLASCRHLELTPNPTPPPLAWLHRAWAFVHVGEYAQAIHALIPNTPTTPFNETTWVLRFFHPFIEVDFPPFVDDFHPEMKVILNQEAFYFCFGSFTTSFFQWPFGYGVWTSTRLFCPIWCYEWFRPLLWGMWAHCSRSCSTFNITFAFCILIFSVEEIV